MKYKYKIAVSGAAYVDHCCEDIESLSRRVGKAIAKEKCVLVTGATTGVPYYSALGCDEADGFNVGFSPAESEASHLKTYKLPVDPFDVIIYTGADYVGRNMIMTKASDAVIIICGRMGTLHEFVTAFEIQKPIGVLEGTGGTADKIKQIVAGPHRGTRKIIYDRDPEKLVERLIEMVKAEKKNNSKIISFPKSVSKVAHK